MKQKHAPKPKVVHYIITFVFLTFAIVQWNDPDYYQWMPPYLIVAYIAFAASREKYYKFWCIMLTILFVVWMSLYIPHINIWLSDGMPSITESMKAESMYIEFIREFFGLLLCFLTTLYYLYLSSEKN